MQSERQKELWQRILQFEIDDPIASVKYSDKLAHHNGWSKEYTKRVIEEYKRFIFLCCVLPNGASPSKPIDEAWHLHLTYTHNYWKKFCEQTLGKEIHHYPSKGGIEEDQRHKYWYDTTLEAYRNLFGKEPPADIWLNSQKSQTVYIGKPELRNYRNGYKRFLYILTLPLVITIIFFGKINPYQITGPQFLVFYSLLVIAVLIYLFLIQREKRQEIYVIIESGYNADADIYQMARFVYGREKSLRAAVVDLVSRHVLEPVRGTYFVFQPSRYTYSTSEKNPLVKELMKHFKESDTISLQSLAHYYDGEATFHAGLSNLYKLITKRDFWPVIITILTIGIAIIRIIQGENNDKPVGYLVMLCVIATILLFIMVSNSAGSKIFRDYFKKNYREQQPTEYEEAAWASSFVFAGMASLTMLTGFSQLANAFSNRNARGDGGSSGGCGSSACGSAGGSCGSSGCGGGGGCGGCGGGD
jgi:uncharacterized protein (TIGR04222 family)